MNLTEAEVRYAQADGASMAIDVWTGYREGGSTEAFADEALRDFDAACAEYESPQTRAAFSHGFIRQLLEVSQIPRQR